MGSASRAKRKRRAAVRSAKRARSNTWWYALTALILIAGVAVVVYARANVPPDVGPFIANQSNPSDPKNANSHWHAALGVYDCDHWVGDSSGAGIWNWPYTFTDTAGQSHPGRAGQNLYAGLHSHDDGIIHMEPSGSDEAGRNATVGRYFEFGGWKLSSTGYTFLNAPSTATVKNGDQCGGKPGTLQWGVAKFNGDVKKAQNFVVKSGNPASYKLLNDDIVVVAFLPQGKTIASIGSPPSLSNLPDAANNEGSSRPTTPTSVPAGPTTLAPTPATAASPTTKP